MLLLNGNIIEFRFFYHNHHYYPFFDSTIATGQIMRQQIQDESHGNASFSRLTLVLGMKVADTGHHDCYRQHPPRAPHKSIAPLSSFCSSFS